MRKYRSPFKKSLDYPNRTISKIQVTVDYNRRLLTAIQNILPPALAGHVIGCSLNHERLYIYAGSAPWATKLRFHHNAILKHLKSSNTATPKKIVIRIGLNKPYISASPSRPVQRPQPDNIDIIKQAGQNTDGELQQALLKLADTLAGKS